MGEKKYLIWDLCSIFYDTMMYIVTTETNLENLESCKHFENICYYKL